MSAMNYRTIQVKFQEPICYIRFDRPEAKNTITDLLIEECLDVLALCEEKITVVVLEGSPEFFCFGADFQDMHDRMVKGTVGDHDPEPLYELWLKLATGPFITISHVRGKANAGGLGFIAASDIVLADETAIFSLSELLFGLFPACVMPFLIRRTGFQKAHYLTLMTQPIQVEQAYDYGLVDAYDSNSDALLRRHLLRLRRLPKRGIAQYKNFLHQLNDNLLQAKQTAVATNRAMFSDPLNLESIFQFVEQGQFPPSRS